MEALRIEAFGRRKERRSGPAHRLLPLLLGVVLAPVSGGQQFGPSQAITPFAELVDEIHLADLDEDGDRDLVSVGSRIEWRENTDGMGSFGFPQVIWQPPGLAVGLAAFSADLDGDGDLDVLTASAFDEQFAWLENVDGQGTFGPQQVITSTSPFSTSNRVAWSENFDGMGSFATQEAITTTAAGTESAFVADLDGDGFPEVLAAAQLDDEVVWFENLEQSIVPTVTTVSASLGGTQTLFLNAASGSAFLTYLVLGTTSGISPGLLISGMMLPLNVDTYTVLTLIAPNLPPLAGSFGTLDAEGRATAKVTLPPLPASLSGSTLHHAFLVIDVLPALLQVTFVSDAAPLLLVP